MLGWNVYRSVAMVNSALWYGNVLKRALEVDVDSRTEKWRQKRH